jgi:hypothetical protein
MAGNVQAAGIEKLNEIDKSVMETLDMIIDASAASLGGDSDVTFNQSQLDGMSDSQLENNGFIHYGEGDNRMEANIAGTGGVALVEHIKTTQQTLTSNITNVMSHMTQMMKVAERNIKGS